MSPTVRCPARINSRRLLRPIAAAVASSPARGRHVHSPPPSHRSPLPFPARPFPWTPHRRKHFLSSPWTHPSRSYSICSSHLRRSTAPPSLAPVFAVSSPSGHFSLLHTPSSDSSRQRLPQDDTTPPRSTLVKPDVSPARASSST